MSVDEEVELKDLVAQTLETNGCLSKIRAELRASIFLALDEDVKASKQQPLLNNRVKSCLDTTEGQTMFCIVREFLEFFNLYFTISVFEPESYLGTHYEYLGREKTAKNLGINTNECESLPLLLQLIKIAQTKNKLDINLNINNNDTQSNDIESENNAKTASNSSTISKNTNKSKSNHDIEVNDDIKPPDLNETFDVKNNETYINNDQDTMENTSSISEDNTANHVDAKRSENNTENSDTSQNTSNETKPKLSPPKNDKIKSKNSLTSLSDLPPLPVNKSRVNDILPSLYSKDFKDKSNIGMFDTEEQYEEDFMYSGDDLSITSDYLKSGQSKINLLDNVGQKSSSDKSGSSKSSRVVSDNKLSFIKPLKNVVSETNGNTESSVSISEHLDVNNLPTPSN